MEYPWYEVLGTTDDLQQGDFIPNCTIVIPPVDINEDSEIEVNIKQIDSIILSQSCDLVNSKVELVLVCPYYPLKTFIDNTLSEQERNSKKAIVRLIDNLKKGYLPAYHLLNKDTETNSFGDYQIVEFRNVYGVHISMLKSLITLLPERTRLLSPYREHLSQAFARYFMRVGLPQDIIIEGY